MEAPVTSDTPAVPVNEVSSLSSISGVKAIDGAGNTSSLKTYIIKVDTVGPEALNNFEANGTGSTQATLGFDQTTDTGSGVAQYIIERTDPLPGEQSDLQSLTYSEIARINADTNSFDSRADTNDTIGFAGGRYSFVDNILEDQTWYSYRVKVIDKNQPAGLEGGYYYSSTKTNTPPEVTDIEASPVDTIDLATVGALGETITFELDATDPDNTTDVRLDFNSENAAAQIKIVDGSGGGAEFGETVVDWTDINTGSYRSAINQGYHYSYSHTFNHNIKYGTYTIYIRVKDSVGTGTHAVTKAKTIVIAPEAPTAQSATGFSSTKIDLSFARPRKNHNPVVLKTNEGIQSYKIYVSKDGNNWSPAGLTSPVTVSADSAYYNGSDDSYAFTYGEDENTEALEMNTTYYFKVTAIDETGVEGSACATFSATTPQVGIPLLPMVSNISNEETEEYRSFVYWNPPENTNDFSGSYELYRATDNLMTDATLIYAGSAKYKLDLGLTPGQSYYYTIKAVDDRGKTSDFTAPVSIVPDEVVDTVPPDITGISIDESANEAIISWDTNEASETLVDLGEEGQSADMGRKLPGRRVAHELDLTDLKPNTKYEYVINSRDATGNEEEKDGTFTTEAFKVSNIALSTTVSSATLDWDTNADGDSHVEFGKTPSTNSITGDYRSVREHRVVIENLKPGTTYYYEIKSKDSYSNIAHASTQSFTTKPFSILNISTTTNTNSAQISWHTNVASDSSVDFRSENENISSVEGSSKTVRDHSVSINGLAPSTAYYYKIKSQDADGNVAESNGILSFRTKNSDNGIITPSVSKINEVDITATTAKISWKTAISTSSWVDYGLSTSYGKKAGNDSMTLDHVINIEGLTSGKTYHYRVRGVDSEGNEFISKDSTFTAQATPVMGSSPKITKISANQATISWSTSAKTSSLVEYGVKASYGESQGKNTQVTNHEVTLTNLEQDSTYHFKVSGVDAFGNRVAGSDATLKTTKDTTGPILSGITDDVLRSNKGGEESISTVVNFQTDESAVAYIEYAEGTSVLSYTMKTDLTKSFDKNHTIIIENLKSSTTYHYRIVVKDIYGNTSKSQDVSILTPKESESILQKIIGTLETAFGWVTNIQNYFSAKIKEVKLKEVKFNE